MTTESLTNPYESIGELHNQSLDYIISSLSASPTVNEILDLTASFVCINNDGITSPTIWQKANYKSMGAYSLNAYLCNDINRNPSSNKSSLAYLYNKISITIMNSVSRNDVRNNLELLEIDLIKSDYSYEVLQPALIAIAVGKHSADYWNYQIDNISTSPWATYLHSNFPDLESGAREIIDADIEAFLVTALVPVISPGVDGTNTITYILVTALVTGVVASAVKVIMGWVKGIFA